MELPSAGTGTIEGKEKLRELAVSRNLISAANNTKWDELITYFRNLEDWRPSYRYKHIGGYVSGWDCEWFYHLPFPLICVEWMEIGMHQYMTNNKYAPNKIIDHSQIISDVIRKIGFEYDIKCDIIRLWGYLPKYEWDLPSDQS